MTVVVPVKNRPRLVLRALESIKAQSWRPIRVVVVDNNSTDDTAAAVAKWAGINNTDGFHVDLVVETEPGPSAARARGLEEVESRLMMHFDSDDTMEPGHIEAIMRRFQAEDYPDLVCFPVRYHHIGGNTTTTHSSAPGLMESHLVHCLLRTQGFACETALMRRVGSWDLELRCWEDYELGVRLLIEARRRAFMPDAHVDVFGREDSVTGAEFATKAGQWERALDKIEKTLESTVNRHRTKWLKYLPYRRIILAAHYQREGRKDLAEELKQAALASPHLNALQRWYLRLAFRYTALGGRGASIPYRFL